MVCDAISDLFSWDLRHAFLRLLSFCSQERCTPLIYEHQFGPTTMKLVASWGFIAFLSKARASWYVWEHIMRPDHPHSGISDTSFYGFCHFVPKADLSILYEHDILVLMSYKNSLRLFLEGEYCHKFQFDRKSPSISPFYRPIWCKIGGNVAYFFCVPKRGNTYI